MSSRTLRSKEWHATLQRGISLSVIVPVFNERHSAAAILTQLSSLDIEALRELEVVMVDDGSTDGSREILERFARSDPKRFKLISHDRNRGKGAAIRSAIEVSTGDLVVFQDADLEYDPRDYLALVKPFLKEETDVVYGSRFLGGRKANVSPLQHRLGNQLITTLSNILTGLDLTDVETCYKMLRAPLLKSIPLRSDDFTIEVELTAKLARRGCRIEEVPISYRYRTHQEGKKIGWRDGLRALFAACRYKLIAGPLPEKKISPSQPEV